MKKTRKIVTFEPSPEVKEMLEKAQNAGFFPPPRISEILKVCRAPEMVYARYHAGFFGFRAALSQCRMYRVTAGDELLRRKIQRTAERLINLMGQGSVTVKGKVVSVEEKR